MSSRTALHFGAGNIGRGLVGLLLAQSNYRVVFADIDSALVAALNEHRAYTVYVLDDDVREERVDGVSAILASDTPALVAALADPALHLVTTSVGVGILPKIAPTLARGIAARREAGLDPINVIACENAVGATSQLAAATLPLLSPEDKAYAAQNVGFADCAVDRIVPPFKDDGPPLSVGVEAFCEWIADETALKRVDADGTLGIAGMTLTPRLSAFVERKLFTLNTAHAVAAYLAQQHAHPTLPAALADRAILRVVRGAMRESGAALLRRHPGFSSAPAHAAYARKVEARFRNPHVRDDVARVAREPLRKLGRGDRLVGPARLAREFGLPIDNLAVGIAAAFAYEDACDVQAVALQRRIVEEGARRVVADVTGWAEGTEEHELVMDAYCGFVERDPEDEM